MKPRTYHRTRINSRQGLWVLVAVAVALSVGTPRLAWAAPAVRKASAVEKRRARKLFFKGLQSFARQQYPDALALFHSECTWSEPPKAA